LAYRLKIAIPEILTICILSQYASSKKKASAVNNIFIATKLLI